MLMLINCSHCHTPLQLPPNAPSIRCAICRSITHVAPSPDVRSPPPPQLARGRKRAVIVGVSYRRSRHELKGSLNDARCMKYFLVNRFHFPEDCILTLTVIGELGNQIYSRKVKRKLIALVLTTTIWHMWKERNRRVFEGIQRTGAAVIELIQEDLKRLFKMQKEGFGDREKHLRELGYNVKV